MTRSSASSLCARLAAMILGATGGDALADTDAPDPDRRVSSEASRPSSEPPSLGAVLEQLPALAQTEVVCTWATGSLEERRAVAEALVRAPEVVGARSALAVLAVDPDGQVRQAAVAALAAYARHSPRV